MNIRVQVPDQVLISFPLCIYLEEEMLDHITVLFNFLRNLYTMFHNGCSNFHTHQHHTGEGNGTPLRYSCLENPMDGGACWAAIYGVAQSRTWLKRRSSSSSSSTIQELSFLHTLNLEFNGIYLYRKYTLNYINFNTKWIKVRALHQQYETEFCFCHIINIHVIFKFQICWGIINIKL